MWIFLTLIVCLVLALAIYDLSQRRHSLLHNFPVIGHFRYWLEAVGPELRQYIVTSNDQERPFSRNQRRWVYASSKRENNYFAFGSDNDLELEPNYLIIKHSAFPLPDPQPGQPGYDPAYPLPCAKVLGAHRQRARQFRPASVVNLSAMSYGSLSAAAVEALNRGCKLAGCLHNTGEGGLSPHHLHGGDLIWQLGTSYFGCRELNGRFSWPKLVDTVQAHSQIKAIEIKLSQGAKPGLGGILPAAKVTPEIAAIRSVPPDQDCISPSAHSMFHDVDSLLDFVEAVAEATGLPVGLKSAVGEMSFWRDLARQMAATERAVDFISIDGGEGGTGSAPLVFADHVALPFKLAFSRVFQVLAEYKVHDQVVLIGSGKLGLPETALFAFGLGCDLVAVAREAMLSIGCIQAQRCHTGHCPAGVATQNRWLARGLDPALKSVRLANYMITLRKELTRLSHACGVPHPALVTTGHFEILDGWYSSATIEDLFGYPFGLGLPSLADRHEIEAIMVGSKLSGERRISR
ncbi:MAG TPA: FMN-binding glutamate synthase family protein [Anaerolineae bacterium]|nr:FMN-binding glutamate synthase family protein [Anaerolineae bacterium]